ncbi:MAG: glycosyltransferase [Spirochaetales bacterium]|nr:glycosyltransferase [Spirochaetales bacterium]
MHVVHIITGLGRGGAESVLLTLAQALEKSGIKCTVISLTGPGPIGTELMAAGIPVHSVPFRGWKGIFAAAHLFQLLRRLRPDLAHTWMYHADLLGGLTAWLCRIPVIWHVHNTTLRVGSSKWSTRLVARLCAGISGFVPREILYCARAAIPVHQRIGYSRKKGILAPNGIDTERYRPRPDLRASLRAELKLPADSFVVAMVARADPLKNHEMLFHASIQLASPSIFFLLCGKDVNVQNPRFERFVKNEYVQAHFRFLGERQDVNLLLNACDCCVLCSFAEAFPVVLGEAMATGLPCIATDVGDCAWIVGNTGSIVPPGGRLDLALKSLSGSDLAVRTQLGRRARQRIVENFGISQFTSTVIAAYTGILE